MGKHHDFLKFACQQLPWNFVTPISPPPRGDWAKKIFMSEQLHRVVLYTKNEKNRRGDGATPGPSVSEFPKNAFDVFFNLAKKS